MYTAEESQYGDFARKQLLGELIRAFGATGRRAGLAFKFDGGNPPWTSAMAQGDRARAARPAATRPRDASYLTTAHDALPCSRPRLRPEVSLRTPLGRRYLQYSFAPGASIINAFLQTLIGLYDYARVRAI